MAAGRPLTFDPEKVLDKILIHFWRHGYERVSMDDICRLCKISKPSLYNMYGSKEELFLKCFDSYNHKFTEALLASMRHETDRKKGFRALLQAGVEHFGNPKFPSGCMAITGLTEVIGISNKIDQHVRRFQKYFLKALTEYFSSQGLGQFAMAQLYSLAIFSRSNSQLFDLDLAVKNATQAFQHF